MSTRSEPTLPPEFWDMVTIRKTHPPLNFPRVTDTATTEARTCPDTRNAPKGPQTSAQARIRADWLDRLATTAPCTHTKALLRAWADDLRAIAPRMKESQ